MLKNGSDMSRNDPVEITVTVIFESHLGHGNQGAILVDVGYYGDSHHREEVWIPKSLIEDWPEVGESGEIEIPEWLAIEEGLV